MRPTPVLTRVLSIAWASVALLGPAGAQEPGDPDAEGCKDLPVLSRMPGCTITECGAKEFEEAQVAVGALDEATAEHPMKRLEGRVETATYICPTKLSLLQVHRNAETALKGAGYELVFSGKARLASQGFGDSKPVADNKTEAGRAKNRRVELVKL